MIDAVGGVVWRPGRRGVIEVLFVHRRRHDDWILPFGLLPETGDPALAATGVVLTLTGSLCSRGGVSTVADQPAADGAPKRVQYWPMRHRSGAFVGGPELDDAWWLPVPLVSSVASHCHDVKVVDALQPGRDAAALARRR